MRHLEDIDLHAFVDEQVGASRRLAITALLEDAPVDAARVNLWRKQNDAIRSHFASVVDEPVPLWLTVGQIASEKPSGPRPLSHPPRPHPRPARVATAAPIAERQRRTPWAAALIIGSAFVVGCAMPTVIAAWPDLHTLHAAAFGASESPLVVLAREAHDTFTMGMTDPAETKGAGIDAWLARRLPYKAAVPDLKALGWSVVGARLLPGERSPDALMIYDNALGDRLSLVVGQSGATLAADPTVGRRGVLAWRGRSLSYAVVTSRSDQYLERNGRALAAAIEDDRAP